MNQLHNAACRQTLKQLSIFILIDMCNGPQPSSTSNIIIQFDGLCLCIVSDRRTIKDVYVL